MAVTDVPTAFGFEQENTEWSDADRAFFAALRAAGMPISFDIKQAFYQWRLSFGIIPTPGLMVEFGDDFSTDFK